MKDWNRIFTPSIKAILDGGKRNLPPQPVKFGMPKAPTLPQPVLPQTANTTQQAQTQPVPFTPTPNQTPAPNQTRIPAYKPTQADIIAKGGSITAPRVNPLLNTSFNDAKKLGQGREWMMAQQQSRNEDRQAKLREKLGGLAPLLVGTGRAEQPNQQKGFTGVLESMGSVAREKGVPGLLTEGFNSLLNPTQEDANRRIFEYRDKLIEAGTDPELAIDKAIRNLANQNPNAPILSRFNVPTEDLTPEEKSALRLTNFTEKLFAGLDAPVFLGTTKPVKMGLKTLLKPATYNPEMTEVVKRFSDIVNKTSRATSAEKIEIKGLAQELGDAMVAKGFIAKEATTGGDKTLANTLRQHMDESLAITQDAQRPAKQAEASRARGGVSDIKKPVQTTPASEAVAKGLTEEEFVTKTINREFGVDKQLDSLFDRVGNTKAISGGKLDFDPVELLADLGIKRGKEVGDVTDVLSYDKLKSGVMGDSIETNIQSIYNYFAKKNNLPFVKQVILGSDPENVFKGVKVIAEEGKPAQDIVRLSAQITKDLGDISSEIRKAESLELPLIRKREAELEEIWKQANKAAKVKQPTATAQPEAVPTPRLDNQSVSSANLSTEAKKPSILEGAKGFDSAEAFVKAQGEPVFHGGAGVKELIKQVKILSPEEKLAFPSSGGGFVGLSTSPDINYAKQFSKNIANSDEVVEMYIKPNARVYEMPDGDIIDDMSANELTDLSKNYDVIKSLEDNEVRILNAEMVQTKAQLTDIWKQANTPKKPSLLDQLKNPAFRQGGYAGGVPKEFPKPKPAPRIKIDSELKDIRTAIKNKDLNAEKIGQLATRIDIAEEALANHPAKALSKYAGKDGLPEVTGSGKSIFARKGDQLADEAGFDTSEEAREAYLKYTESTTIIKELRDELKPAKAERALANKASKVASTVSAERKSYVRFLQDQFQLTDGEIKKLTFGRDLQRMGESEFNGFIRGMENRAMQMQNTKQAKWELNALIEDKHFDKVENYRKAQDLPPVSQMNEAQLRQYAKSLEGFSVGDEFLSPRTLETISRTELGSVKTMREVRVHLWEELKKNPEFKDIKLEDLENMTSTTLDSMRYDTALAEANPFYNLVVKRTQTEVMRGKASFLKVQAETNRLTAAANKSRNTSIFSKAKQSLVPKQKEIVRYLEAEPEAKEAAMKALTKEELDLAVHMEQYYRGALDHLIAIEELRGSRYADAYFTHTKKQFLESWSDDGLINAVRGVFQAQKDAAQVAKIIDQDTGQILSKSKFFKYTLRRTGEGEASNNATKVFLDYVEQMERKKMLDRVIPEIEVYTQALTPKGLTEKGLELDRSLKTFINKYLNNKKGRRENFGGLLEQGGKLDVTLRLGNIVVSIKDLGFSVLSQTAAVVGESVVTYVALGAKGVAKGAKRRVWDAGLKGYIDPNAAKIIKEAEPFIGRNVWTELAEPNISLGEKGLNAMFIGFAQSSVEMNKIFLLSRMTKAELRAGKLSSARLAELRLEAGRWRDLGADVKSIYGATSAGAAVNKYKGWAIPIARTTAKNLTTLATRIKSGKLKGIITSREMQETIREVQATALIFYVGSQAMQDNDEDTFAGKWYARIQLEALTIIGAVDPRLFVGEPRLLSFLTKLTDNLVELAMWSEYKTDGKDFKEGDLKGLTAIQRQFTPSAFRQFAKPNRTSGDAELDTFLKEAKDEKQSISEEVETVSKELGNLPPEQANARLTEIAKTNLPLAKKIKAKVLADKKKADWTPTDQAISQLGVENGKRAEYVFKKANTMQPEEANAYIKDLAVKGVISKSVVDQIRALKQQQSTSN